MVDGRGEVERQPKHHEHQQKYSEAFRAVKNLPIKRGVRERE
jgi:hypothetical protein